jgi:hypothetical protein
MNQFPGLKVIYDLLKEAFQHLTRSISSMESRRSWRVEAASRGVKCPVKPLRDLLRRQ